MIILKNQSVVKENDIFSKYSRRPEGFNQVNYWYKDPKKDLKPFEHLINKSYELLSKNGYQSDKNVYQLEFHSYNLFDNKFINNFAWHQDDYGGISEKVNTIIYYLKKDDSIKKGNFLYKDVNNKNCEIIIENNMILMLDGRITHKPDDLEGRGCRESIVVQFKRK